MARVKTEDTIAKEEFNMREKKKGGKVKKDCYAAGGVGKIRHEQSTKTGKPLSKPEFKKKRI